MGLCIREGVSTNSLGSMMTHLIIKLLRHQLADHKLIMRNSGAFFISHSSHLHNVSLSAKSYKPYNALQLGWLR